MSGKMMILNEGMDRREGEREKESDGKEIKGGKGKEGR